MIRVVIADDHTLMREGLKQLIHHENMTVVGEASDGDVVMQLVRQLEFDVLLLDLSMPGRSGMELIKWAKTERPALKVLVLSMHSERQYAVRALRAGASGYITKESAPSQVIAAIQKVASGGVFVTPAVGELLALESMAPSASALPHERLSDREFQVFRLIVAGRPIHEIAERLNLSAKTVSTHKARLMEKMGLQNNADLVRYAITHGLDTSGSEPPL